MCPPLRCHPEQSHCPSRPLCAASRSFPCAFPLLRPLWVHGLFRWLGRSSSPLMGLRACNFSPCQSALHSDESGCHIRLPLTIPLPSSRVEVCIPPLSVQGLHPRMPFGALLELTLRYSANSGPPPLGGWTPRSPESGMPLNHPKLMSRFLCSSSHAHPGLIVSCLGREASPSAPSSFLLPWSFPLAHTVSCVSQVNTSCLWLGSVRS